MNTEIFYQLLLCYHITPYNEKQFCIPKHNSNMEWKIWS